MKNCYCIIIFLTLFSSMACKNKERPDKDVTELNQQRSPEEDRKILDEKIAYTQRIWDSLDKILTRQDLEPEYRDSVRRLFFKNKDAQEEIFKDFIRENPASEISLINLNGFKFAWGKETTEALFEPMDEGLKNSKEGRSVAKYLKYYHNPQVNDRFTDFELPSLQGKDIVLSKNLSEYTLLEFWASWCHGCREKHPALIEVYEEYKDKGFAVIGISGDNSEDDWKNAVRKDELPWLNLRDAGGRESIVQYQYGIHYLPANFLIGPEGKIIAKDLTPEELSEVLQQLVSQRVTVTDDKGVRRKA